jgi:hypothetical protein
MKGLRPAAIPTIAITSVLLILASGYAGLAQTPAPPPTLAPPLISLAEARVIIDGAIAFTREQNLNMAVVVVDAAGNLVSADKMDGTTINSTRFAEGKAFASAILRQTTEVLANLAKDRPDRYFGIRARSISSAAECRSPSTAASSGPWALPDCPKVSTRRQRGPGSRLGTSSANA